MQKLSLTALIVASLCFCLTANAADEPALKVSDLRKSGDQGSRREVQRRTGLFLLRQLPRRRSKANTKKFATKANAQLVASGQYKQVKCPLSGEDSNPATAVKVADVSVSFCCDKCKAKVEAAKDKKQLNMVFNDKAFDKAFVKAKDTK